jgi:hypothetical protein
VELEKSMSLAIHPELETKIRARAEAEGLSIEAYLERLMAIDQQANDELQLLALEGLDSGEAIEGGPGYWEQKHRRLDERLKNVGIR